MQRLTSSLVRFTWAGSLFAARQAMGLATAWWPGSGEERRRVAVELDRVGWEAARQLGATGTEAYQVGDALQRDLLALVLPADPWQPADWLRSAAEVVSLSGRTLRFLEPSPEGIDAWRELTNKLEVYRLVRQVGSRIGMPPEGETFDLLALVRRAYGLDDFAALWAVEGLGHRYADRCWPRHGDPRDLLTGGDARELPAESLTMLHAGIGLAFAERLLAELPPAAGALRNRETVGRILALCRANSRPGYTGAALESLGLVTRTFHGGRVAEVDAALLELGEEAARESYWHGVGRALYFLPVNFLPLGDTSWRPFEMTRDEAPDSVARRNALAGLGWAFTLVNMRRPELMDRLLLARHGAALSRQTGFANGVASSLVMRSDTTPAGLLVERFLEHRPSSGAVVEWEELVLRPGRHAVGQVWPRLRRDGHLEEIFRYQPWLGRRRSENGSPGDGASR